MKESTIKYLLLISPILVLLIGLSLQPRYEIYSGETLFNGERAYSYLKYLTSRYRYRVVGSQACKNASLWIKSFFEKLGYKPVTQVFSVKDFTGKLVNGTNIYVVKKGVVDRYIIIVAHFDIVPKTIEGANDNGAGVSILLELARVFVNRSTYFSIIFLACDAEEVGLKGSEYFAKTFKEIDKVEAAISIDMCGWKETKGVELIAYYDSWTFSDAGLLVLFLSANSLGYEVTVGFDQFLSRILGFTFAGTDSMSFIGKNIPALGITDYPLYPYWHTPEDTIDKVSPEKLMTVGTLTERIILTIDNLKGVPKIGVHYLILNNNIVLYQELIYGLLLAFILHPIAEFLWLGKKGAKAIKGAVLTLVFFLVVACSLVAVTYTMSLFKTFIEPLIIGILTLVTVLKIIGKRLDIEWIHIKKTSIAGSLALYSLSIINPVSGLMLLSPLLVASSVVKPVKGLKKFITATVMVLLCLSPVLILFYAIAIEFNLGLLVYYIPLFFSWLLYHYTSFYVILVLLLSSYITVLALTVNAIIKTIQD